MYMSIVPHPLPVWQPAAVPFAALPWGKAAKNVAFLANVKKKFDNSGKCNTLKVVRRGDQKVQEHGSV